MRLLRKLFRSGRALAALMLLAALVAGAVADGRHHLSEQGCASDSHGRDDNCTCASLHAASLTSVLPAAGAPVECVREVATVSIAATTRPRAARDAAPRAPPRG